MVPWLADLHYEAENAISFTYSAVQIWSDIKVMGGLSLACMQQDLTDDSCRVL